MKKLIMALASIFAAAGLFAGKPVALIGFGTDIKAMRSEVLSQSRLASVMFKDKWVEPNDYGKYSVLDFGEKLRGEALGKNWIEGEARAAAEKFLADGGTVIVAGKEAMNELFGKPNRKNPHPLREKVIYIPESYGRMLANFAKAKKPLSFPDDAGNDILTDEGRRAKALQDRFIAAFAQAKDVEKLPEGEKWEAVPLGAPGDMKLPTSLSRRPVLGKRVARPDGLTILDGAVKAVIVVPPEEEECRKLADELAWHLEKMSGKTFDIVDRVPEKGPALVYRTVRCPKGFPRGTAAYFKIWREGERVILGGEDAGLSRATTYVLEALGCRYIWPGVTGKIIPKRAKIVLPDISVEDATSFVIRRIRLYGQPEWRDDPANRDFYRWHGMNDNRLMTSEKPNDADGYQWGHYYKDYYKKYYKTHRDWFALQPDSTRTLNLGSHPERPTFCMSNPGLAEETARRIKEAFRRNPAKKALSICLPDGATSTWCMCEECRKMDPVNAPAGGITVFFPSRRALPYVSFTDRTFAYMNRIAEMVAEEFPDKLLSCYAYGGYTKPPVKVKPHRNLLILSVAGYYPSYGRGDEVEKNLAAWANFGNKLLWRPNAHGSFYIAAPDNFGRRMFHDISLMGANGIFGVDYDTMSCEWATKPFVYYMVCRAHYNPDRLDFDSIADDYCRAGFGKGARAVRAYFDAVEKACHTAAAQNAADTKPPTSWADRVRRRCRLTNATDYDELDRHLAAARALTAGDEAIAFRLARLQFGTDLGRRMKKICAGEATEAEKEEARRFIADYLEKDPGAYPKTHDRLVIK
jgi:hypothetical protein